MSWAKAAEMFCWVWKLWVYELQVGGSSDPQMLIWSLRVCVFMALISRDRFLLGHTNVLVHAHQKALHKRNSIILHVIKACLIFCFRSIVSRVGHAHASLQHRLCIQPLDPSHAEHTEPRARVSMTTNPHNLRCKKNMKQMGILYYKWCEL